MIDVAQAAVAAEVAQTGIHIDTSINLTLIIGVIVWIVTITVAWSKFGGRQDLFDQRLTMLAKAMESVGEALKKLADNDKELALLKQTVTAQDTQLALMNRTIEDLRRGTGWVGQRRTSVNGEYG